VLYNSNGTNVIKSDAKFSTNIITNITARNIGLPEIIKIIMSVAAI